MGYWNHFNEIFRWSRMLQKTLVLIALLSWGAVSGGRVRRHLVFSEGSRLFFSVDVRSNLFDYSDFFAEVFGVKMDWDLPSSVIQDKNKGRIQRRDLYQGMETFLYRQNMNGTHCVRKFLCEALLVLPKSDHFLAQLYEVIFSPKHEDREAYDVDPDKDCTEMLLTPAACPISLTSILSGHFKTFSH